MRSFDIGIIQDVKIELHIKLIQSSESFVRCLKLPFLGHYSNLLYCGHLLLYDVFPKETAKPPKSDNPAGNIRFRDRLMVNEKKPQKHPVF